MRRSLTLALSACLLALGAPAAQARGPHKGVYRRAQHTLPTVTRAIIAPVGPVTMFHLIQAGSQWNGPSDEWAGLAASVEQAVVTQVDTQVARHWDVPRIAFGSAGIPVYLVALDRVAAMCGDADSDTDGCHGSNATGSYILVGSDGQDMNWSAVLSHEVLETLIDPGLDTTIAGTLAEICDPVAGHDYLIDGLLVSDFVYPDYFTAGTTGAWDHMGDVTAPLTPASGYQL